MNSHETYMNRCLQLAKLGQGNVAPNPMVGAVIVHNDKIIGEGYHEKFGEPHAEVNAINSVQDKSLLKEAMIYVSLEPCAHFGKTPPCANLIVTHQFKKVIIGSRDPHSKVDGKGVLILKKNDIAVITGVLKEKCDELNKRFFTFHKKKRPFVVLKWAETENGKIDNGGNKNEVTWITCPETQVLVHQMRKENQSILVGKNTVRNDNPSLTLRKVLGRNPVRIVLDSKKTLDSNRTIFNNEAKTIILNTEQSLVFKNNEWIKIDILSPENILEAIYKQNIDSILIEGGRATLQSFIDADLWDEAHIFIGNRKFEIGTNAPELNHKPLFSELFFQDKHLFFKNKK